MTDFISLSMQEQAERIRLAALPALAAYGLAGAQVSLIKHEMNTVFQVTDDAGRRYVLRVHPDFWLDARTIGSELMFLEALGRDGRVAASTPVRALDGSFVQKIAREDMPGPRCMVLFAWLEGETPASGLAPHTLRAAGECLARLHEFGRDFTPPPGFARPRLDFGGLFGRENGLYSARWGDAFFSPEQKDTLARAGEKLRARLARIGCGADDFGFIHGDFYYRNLILRQGEVGLIDFDLCGLGYYLFDLVVPFWPKAQGDINGAYCVFLEGYARVRPVPRGFAEFRPDMEACRRLMDAYWLASRQDLPLVREGLNQRMLPRVLAQLEQYARP